jgi:hypothetical protein
MEEILTTLNFKANNLEETCCGIRNSVDYYKVEKNREKLIQEIETDLELFIEAFNKLKAVK